MNEADIARANKAAQKHAALVRTAAINGALFVRDVAVDTVELTKLGAQYVGAKTAEGTTELARSGVHQARRAFAYVGGFVRTFVGKAPARSVSGAVRSARRDVATTWRETARPKA